MNEETRARLLGLRQDNDAHAAFMAANSERFDRYRTRHEDGTAPRAVAAFNLFQTPAPLAARMVELAKIQPWQNVLEPSAGLGRILAPVMACNPARVVACDISPDCCREIMGGFPTVALVQGDFLDEDTRARCLAKIGQPAEDSEEEPHLFDRIVMNPPFKMRADLQHIEAALELLAPGGRLVGLCLDGYKRRAFLETMGADFIEEIPAGTFKGEGTDVPTLLFTFEI